MAEIWGAAIAVGGAALSGAAKSKQAKQDRKNAKEDAKIANEDEAKWGSLMSQFDKEQDYRYEQMSRKNKQRGLDEFRKFSTVSTFAPEYQQTQTGVEVPEARTMSDLNKEYSASEATNTGNPDTYGGKRKKSTWEEIDPLGAATLGKLF